MKYIFIILLLGLSFNIVNAQNDAQSQKFIREVIPGFIKDNETKDVIYSDGLWDITDIKKKLDVDTLQSRIWRATDSNPDARIIFTKAERVFIKSELDKMATFRWTEGLLANAKMIKQDTVFSVFNDRSKGWSYFYNHFGFGYYSFSKPIFIRNNSICFFYRDHSACDLCGSGELAAYVLKKGKWVKLMTLYAWVS